jgi:hypothetical protein
MYVYTFTARVHVLYEQGYVIPSVANLTDEKSCVRMPELSKGI